MEKHDRSQNSSYRFAVTSAAAMRIWTRRSPHPIDSLETRVFESATSADIKPSESSQNVDRFTHGVVDEFLKSARAYVILRSSERT